MLGEEKIPQDMVKGCMPKTKTELLEMIPVVTTSVDAEGLRPFVLFPFLALWQPYLARRLAGEKGLMPEHSARNCAKCQGLFVRYTSRSQAKLNLKHSRECCPLGNDKDKETVYLKKYKSLIDEKTRHDPQDMHEFITDAIKLVKSR